MATTQPRFAIEGLRELRAELRELSGTGIWTREFREGGKRAVEAVVPYAKSIAPKISGALAGTIRPLADGTSFAIAAGNNTDVPYAGPIHWGWPKHNIRANPFLVKALDDKEELVLAIFVQSINDVTRRAFPEGP